MGGRQDYQLMNDGGVRGGKRRCCAVLKKKGNKVNVSTQKAHKYCHQFERRVVRVVAINLSKGARLLLEILGHWWSRGAIGHCVVVFENFVPPVHYVFTGVSRKKSILLRHLLARITTRQRHYDVKPIRPLCGAAHWALM